MSSVTSRTPNTPQPGYDNFHGFFTGLVGDEALDKLISNQPSRQRNDVPSPGSQKSRDWKSNRHHAPRRRASADTTPRTSQALPSLLVRRHHSDLSASPPRGSMRRKGSYTSTSPPSSPSNKRNESVPPLLSAAVKARQRQPSEGEAAPSTSTPSTLSTSFPRGRHKGAEKATYLDVRILHIQDSRTWRHTETSIEMNVDGSWCRAPAVATTALRYGATWDEVIRVYLSTNGVLRDIAATADSQALAFQFNVKTSSGVVLYTAYYQLSFATLQGIMQRGEGDGEVMHVPLASKGSEAPGMRLVVVMQGNGSLLTTPTDDSSALTEGVYPGNSSDDRRTSMLRGVLRRSSVTGDADDIPQKRVSFRFGDRLILTPRDSPPGSSLTPVADDDPSLSPSSLSPVQYFSEGRPLDTPPPPPLSEVRLPPSDTLPLNPEHLQNSRRITKRRLAFSLVVLSIVSLVVVLAVHLSKK